MKNNEQLQQLLKFTPSRWLVLFIDFLFTFICFPLAILLRFEFNVPQIEWLIFKEAVPVIIILLLVSFKIGTPYAGLLRYTGITEVRRLFFTLLAFASALFLANAIRYFLIDEKFVLPSSVIVISFLFSFFSLSAYRFSIRLFFIQAQVQGESKINAAIYGAGEGAFLAKRTIEKDAQNQLSIKAFFDSDKKKVKKRLEGIDVFHHKDLVKVIEAKKIKKLIFSVQKPDKQLEKEVKKICFDYGVSLLKVPPADQWINGELSSAQIREIKIEDLLGREKVYIHNDKFNTEYANKTVMVTGGAGSIGSEICRQLLENKVGKLIILDQAESPLYELQNELLKAGLNNFEIAIADVSSKHRIRKAFVKFKPQIIFHAAAYKHVPLMEENPAEALRVNLYGTRTLADLSVEYGVEKFVFISTDKAVNPTNVMGASKRAAEMYVQSLSNSSNTNFITTRFGNVLGSNGSVVPLFRKQIENGGPITVTHPDITRFFMTIPEAVHLVLHASILGKGGEIFLFDMGESVKISTLAKKMISLAGLELDKDITIEYTGLRPGEKLFEELLANEENTLPTPHEKIMIGKNLKADAEMVTQLVNSICDSIDNQNNEELIKLLKSLVKEYKSQNSEYEKLDAGR